MDRLDDFKYFCKKYDKNVSFIKNDISCKDEFLIKSARIYTKLFSCCDYIDNNILNKCGLFLGSSKYTKQKKTRIKNKDNLLFPIKRISEEIKNLTPQVEIHNYVLNCLTNLLNIFIDILNKYENNLSGYNIKLNKYTNFYFYDVKNIKCDLDYLNTLNNYIYSSNTFENNLKRHNHNYGIPSFGTFTNINQKQYDSFNSINNKKEIIYPNESSENGNNKANINDKNKANINDKNMANINDKNMANINAINYLTNPKHISNDINYLQNDNNEFTQNEKGNTFEDNERDIKNKTYDIYEKKQKMQSTYLGSISDNNNTNLRERKERKKKVMFDTYNYLDEEEEKKKKTANTYHDNIPNQDGYMLNNNQKLEFKKYVDLFEKEENTYVMETQKKIAKIGDLMNIFVNKIYEQNENLKMIEHIVEQSIENVSQGNTYLNKIQKKKNTNSLIFFVLICTSIFLFVFDFFR
ncbi:syntaxin, Qa-SNARE family [Hepatocystis sp. ex Piliocolobus tephrosceles]|nr:syntaxin, Qa-SNARE family [Hepatocystis sp. ex Piliocolobus tephrosceles]